MFKICGCINLHSQRWFLRRPSYDFDECASDFFCFSTSLYTHLFFLAIHSFHSCLNSNIFWRYHKQMASTCYYVQETVSLGLLQLLKLGSKSRCWTQRSLWSQVFRLNWLFFNGSWTMRSRKLDHQQENIKDPEKELKSSNGVKLW